MNTLKNIFILTIVVAICCSCKIRNQRRFNYSNKDQVNSLSAIELEEMISLKVGFKVRANLVDYEFESERIKALKKFNELIDKYFFNKKKKAEHFPYEQVTLKHTNSTHTDEFEGLIIDGDLTVLEMNYAVSRVRLEGISSEKLNLEVSTCHNKFEFINEKTRYQYVQGFHASLFLLNEEKVKNGAILKSKESLMDQGIFSICLTGSENTRIEDDQLIFNAKESVKFFDLLPTLK